jgi:hypothetical protein
MRDEPDFVVWLKEIPESLRYQMTERLINYVLDFHGIWSDKLVQSVLRARAEGLRTELRAEYNAYLAALSAELDEDYDSDDEDGGDDDLPGMEEDPRWRRYQAAKALFEFVYGWEWSASLQHAWLAMGEDWQLAVGHTASDIEH